MAIYCEALLKMLQDTAVLCDLDTAKTEALMAWVSTAMETHTQNTSRLRQTLMNGLKDFDWIMNDPKTRDAFLCVFLTVTPGINSAYIIHKPGKPTKAVVQIRR